MPSSTGRSPFHGASSRRRAIRNSLLGHETPAAHHASNAGANAAAASIQQSHNNNGPQPPPPSSTASIHHTDHEGFFLHMEDTIDPEFSPNFTQSRLSFGSTSAAAEDSWGRAHSPSASVGLGLAHSHSHSNSVFDKSISTRSKIDVVKRKSRAGRLSISTSRLRNSTGGVLVNSIPLAEDVDDSSHSNVHVHVHVSKSEAKSLEKEKMVKGTVGEEGEGEEEKEKDVVPNGPSAICKEKDMDPIGKLRKLVASCLHSASSVTTASPGSAVFYASILYTKTKSAKDAYLFASALSANQEKRRAAFILEKAGLLSFETLTFDEQEYRDEKEYVRLIVEAMLLAAHCLETFGEWDEVTGLLESVEQYDFEISLEEMKDSKILSIVQRDHYQGGTDSEYQREVGLLRLAHFLSSTVEQGDIHPIARLCLLRGKAFDEASNPSRAATFLKLALEIDVKCIDAWTYLCQRRLLTAEEEIRFVTGLRFDESDMDWLKDMVYAKLSVSGTLVSNKVETATKTGLSTLASPIAKSSPMNILPGNSTPFVNMTLDSSSIHYHQGTPFQFTSGGAVDSSVMETPLGTAKAQDNLITKQVEDSFQNLHFKHDLSQSPDVLGLAATRAYNNYNLALALHYCQVLYEMDPLSMDTANIQIATLTALGQKRPLFRLAHTLVDADSKSAIAWYAVGCYYYSCGRYALAQQHFWRSTRLDRRNAFGWVAFGCAFAACDENDQANACFRTAQRLNSGSHYPMLYMGMEHLRTNNIQLARHFLKSARNMEKNDPLCCNELGVWAYRSKNWSDAIHWFVLALRLHAEAQISEKSYLSWNEEDGKDDSKTNKPRFAFGQRLGRDTCDSFTERDCVDFCQDPFWECTIFNLGQSYRKLRRYDDAINCFLKSLALCPEKAMSFSALGFVRHLTGNIDGAIESYHQALSRKPDDPFATEMLNRAMREALDFGPLSITGDSMNTVKISVAKDKNRTSTRNFMNQESINESAFSLNDSDVDMSMS